MTFAPPSIPLPRGVAREIGPLWDVLVAALAQLFAQFGQPETLVRGNGPPAPLLRWSLLALGRLERIARFLLIVHAARLLKLDPSFGAKQPKLRPRAAVGRRARRQIWRTTPLLAPPPRLAGEPHDERSDKAAGPPRPPGARDTVLRLARKMEGLRRLLARADHYVHRLARRLRRCFVPVRRPRSRLPGPYGGELMLAQDAAAWALAAANTS